MIFYHEAPLCMFKDVQKLTGGDYALVHLLSDPSYFEIFRDAVESGRDVILDNSLHELGEAFDDETFAHWVTELCPSWYIVPDVFHKGEETIRRFKEFTEKFPSLPGKRIGVIQGLNVDEMVKCYREIEPGCDMVAIPFETSWLSKVLHPNESLTLRERMSLGRAALISTLRHTGVLNEEKPHHLLGAGIPQESTWYANYSCIRSIDTCAPVLEGLYGNVFNRDKDAWMSERTPVKICDIYSETFGEDQINNALENIKIMQEWPGGDIPTHLAL